MPQDVRMYLKANRTRYMYICIGNALYVFAKPNCVFIGILLNFLKRVIVH